MTDQRFPEILLFSGGIDSFVAYHFLNKPKTLYFDLGTPYSEKELRVVQQLIPTTIIETCLDLGTRQIGENAYIPFRNLHIALLAARYSDKIIIAGLKDDAVSDKNEQVFDKFSKLMSEMEGREIIVYSPFWRVTKEDVVRLYLDLGAPREELLKTISCYSDEDTNYCGKCPSCFRKWCAFRANGIDIPFHNDVLMARYFSDARAGKYDKQRNEAIMREVKRYLT